MALKFFLRASEMETDPEHKESNKIRTRTWWGIKLVSGAGVEGAATFDMLTEQSTRRLLERKTPSKIESAVPEEQRCKPKQLQALDQLATERILAAGGSGLDIQRKVLSADTQTVR